MSNSPLEEAPVYHKSLTPESPRPIHVPSPANIPILENQIEPIFNLISSHLHPPYAARDLTHMDQELAAAAATLSSDIPVQNLDANSIDPELDGPYPADPDHANEEQDHIPDAAVTTGNSEVAESSGTAVLNNDDPLAAVANPSSHAANLSIPSQAEAEPADSALPATSTESAQDTATAPAGVPSLDREVLNPPQDVASDGMQALLESLNAPRNVQTEPFASIPGLSDDAATTSLEEQQVSEKVLPPTSSNAVPTETTNVALSLPQKQHDTNGAAHTLGTDTNVTSQPQPPGINGALIPPPPGLGVGAFQALNGSITQPLTSPLNNLGAPGVPPPGTDSQTAGNTADARYTAFLDEESVFTAEGAWEKFPHGSRLFVGNLPTEAVSKRDVWNIFEKYGKLAQISIKQAYGFVQFMDVESCQRAMSKEQGARLKERSMHLEVSKPPKAARNSQTTTDCDRLRDRHRRNRSRSPDRRRGGGGSGGAGQRGQQGRNLPYSDFRDEPRRARDDYRPGRSPSPRRRGDDYRPGRGRSAERFYDDRRRSRSPYGRGPRRSPSPHRTNNDDDDLPLPRRAPRDVPDVQIILLEDLSRPFIDFVVRGFRDEGMRVDVLNMPRVSLDVVIKRQIVEGVLAVCRLTRNEERTGKVPLQVFDRTQGSQNVRFDEYDNLEMPIAAKLAARAKATAVPQSATYGNSTSAYVPPYMQQSQATQPSVIANNPQLQQLITTLDGPALQQLLSAMGQQQGTPTQAGFPQQAMSGQPDVSAFLGSMPAQQQQQAAPQAYQYAQQASQPATHQAPYSYAAGVYPGQQTTAAYPSQGYGQRAQQDPNQVQSIMQQLAGIQRKA